MPYIEQKDRDAYDTAIDRLVGLLADQPIGHVNYVISRIIWKLFRIQRSYTAGNNLIGVLECAKAEFYRRQLAPYEDEKLKENGDVDI